MKNLDIVLMPTSLSCNMQCKYCFQYSNQKSKNTFDKGIMSEKTAQLLIARAFQSQFESISFTFSGGEPCIIGIDFFKKFVLAVNKINENKTKITYKLCTNGLLLNRDWIKFLMANNFLVDISLDGVAEVHNEFRIANGGLGTHAQVLSAIELLKQARIPISVSTVVTKELADKMLETYNLYKQLGIKRVDFFPFIEDLKKQQKEANKAVSYAIDAKTYGEFLIELFDLWYDDYKYMKYMHINLFDNIIRAMSLYSADNCKSQGICSKKFIVEADGSIYPCDWYVLDEFKLGNISKSSFVDVAKNEKAVKFIDDSKMLVNECGSCNFLNICNGGCRRDREHSLDKPFYKNRYCESLKVLYAHIIKVFK